MMTKLANLIPSQEENKKMEELFLAIFFNDIEKVKEFKNQYPEIYSKKGHFLLDDNIQFDLTNLTFLNQSVWKDDDWREAIMPFIKKNRQQTKQMIDFWSAEFAGQDMQRVIEYNQYYDYFYCDDPNEAEEDEEVLLEPISYYIEKGFREIDIKLYSRVECFNFVEAKKLLELGANPDINFDNDEYSSALSRIGRECSYLATSHVVPEFENFELERYNQNFDIKYLFRNILGLAAHHEMYKLLNKYSKQE